jgi:hypothetical protein
MTSVVSSRVAPGGTPSAVFFDGTFYVFYVVPSSGANSIWYVTSDDGIHWGQPQQVPLPMAVADGASPTAFVSGSTLYLFWFSKNGLQATATSDGQSWAGVTSFSGGQVFSLPANASAAVVGNQLAVFWPGNSIAYHSTVAG